MTTRILLADQGTARFYDVGGPGNPLKLVSELTSSAAHLHDRDLKSDKPGRVFSTAGAGSHRRGAVVHHSTGGEETPRRHIAHSFASQIVSELEEAHSERKFDELVVIAGPRFIGLIRSVMPKRLAALVKVEVVRDLVHEPESVIREYLPVQVISARAKLAP
jgi:protein required for attachment to host cells